MLISWVFVKWIDSIYNTRFSKETQCQQINFQTKFLIENDPSRIIHYIFESQLFLPGFKDICFPKWIFSYPKRQFLAVYHGIDSTGALHKCPSPALTILEMLIIHYFASQRIAYKQNQFIQDPIHLVPLHIQLVSLPFSWGHSSNK